MSVAPPFLGAVRDNPLVGLGSPKLGMCVQAVVSVAPSHFCCPVEFAHLFSTSLGKKGVPLKSLPAKEGCQLFLLFSHGHWASESPFLGAPWDKSLEILDLQSWKA